MVSKSGGDVFPSSHQNFSKSGHGGTTKLTFLNFSTVPIIPNIQLLVWGKSFIGGCFCVIY